MSNKPSNRVFCFRWECPNCKYIVGFLPNDLELPCPRCDKGKVLIHWGTDL